MNAFYILIACSFCLTNAMDNSDSSEDMGHPTIVLDVDLIADENVEATTPSWGQLRKQVSVLGCRNVCSLIKNYEQIREHGQELAKTVCGATNVAKQLFQERNYNFNQEQIESLVALDIQPALREGVPSFLRALKDLNFPILAATNHDPHHYLQYAGYLAEKHNIKVQDYFAGAVVIKGPFEYDKSDIPYFISEEPRPSYTYLSAILKQVAENKSVLFFEACETRVKKQQRLIKKDKDNNYGHVQVFHTQTIGEVRDQLKMLGYLE